MINFPFIKINYGKKSAAAFTEVFGVSLFIGKKQPDQSKKYTRLYSLTIETRTNWGKLTKNLRLDLLTMDSVQLKNCKKFGAPSIEA